MFSSRVLCLSLEAGCVISTLTVIELLQLSQQFIIDAENPGEIDQAIFTDITMMVLPMATG